MNVRPAHLQDQAVQEADVFTAPLLKRCYDLEVRSRQQSVGAPVLHEVQLPVDVQDRGADHRAGAVRDRGLGRDLNAATRKKSSEVEFLRKILKEIVGSLRTKNNHRVHVAVK